MARDIHRPDLKMTAKYHLKHRIKDIIMKAKYESENFNISFEESLTDILIADMEIIRVAGNTHVNVDHYNGIGFRF